MMVQADSSTAGWKVRWHWWRRWGDPQRAQWGPAWGYLRRFRSGVALVLGPLHITYTYRVPQPLCRFHSFPAVAVFELSDGCVCFPEDRRQALCLHHAMRASPLGGMRLVCYTPVATRFDKRVLLRRYGFPT